MKEEKETEFSYDNMNEKERTFAKFQAEKIHGLLNDSTSTIVEIGKSLYKVHQKIGKDHFQAWLKSEFQWSQSVASNYMQIAKRFGNLSCLEQFQPSALYVLVRKNVPQQALKSAIKLARSGETITHKIAKELIYKHTPNIVKSKAQSARKEEKSVEEQDPLMDGMDNKMDRPELDIMEVPADLDSLRASLDSFCNRVKKIADVLSKNEREEIADKLLELALALRTTRNNANHLIEEEQTTRKPKTRSRTSRPKPEAIAV